MAKFNMNTLGVGGGLLNQVSQELKEGFEIEYIKLDDLTPNEQNKYSMENIEDLAESILTAGLKQNLDVIRMNNGKCKIVTGHRRYAALKLLVSQGHEKFNLAPCTVSILDSVKLPVSDENKELYLINVTNAEARKDTVADIYNQFLDYHKIYTDAKNNGYQLNDKMRNLIATDMSLSPAQVAKMYYISSHGSDELLQAISENKVTIAQANEIAHAPEELQKTLIPDNENESSNDDNDAEKDEKTEKDKKPKIIDTLKHSNYIINEQEIRDIQKQYQSLATSVQDTINLNKKDYAKLLTSREKIMLELKKIEALVEKNQKK